MKVYIYEIISKLSGIKYIGSTVNFKARFDNHKRDLRKNDHHNQYLQNSWNKYGEENFEFKVVLCVEVADRNSGYDLETSYIKNTPKKKRFNDKDLAIGATGCCSENSSYFFIAPWGQFFSGENVAEFCRRFKLKQSDMIQLKLGNLRSACGGWTINMKDHCIYKFYGSFLYERNGNSTPVYKLTNPEGVTYKVFNLSKFCKENKLNQGKINCVINKTRPHHKNWSAERCN